MTYESSQGSIIFAKIESIAPVAQWIRASRFGREGRGFESLQVRIASLRAHLAAKFACSFVWFLEAHSVREFLHRLFHIQLP